MGVSPPRLESPKEQRDIWTIATSYSCSYCRLEQTRNIDMGFVNQEGPDGPILAKSPTRRNRPPKSRFFVWV